MESWSRVEFLIALLLFLNASFATKGENLNDEVLNHDFFKAYKDCDLKKETVYLSQEEMNILKKHLGKSGQPRFIKTYTAACESGQTRVYLLSDLVRTHYQKGFVAISNNKVSGFEVVKFLEPQRYKAPLKYLAKLLNQDSFKNIDGITGATLTHQSALRMAKTALKISDLRKNDSR